MPGMWDTQMGQDLYRELWNEQQADAAPDIEHVTVHSDRPGHGPYTVILEDGDPVSCDCPATRGCKHMYRAVAKEQFREAVDILVDRGLWKSQQEAFDWFLRATTGKVTRQGRVRKDVNATLELVLGLAFGDQAPRRF